MKTKKITRKEIVKTIRSYNVTEICKLYKRIHGEVPTETRGNGNYQFTCLNGFKVYQWAENFATSRKMGKRLYHLFDKVSHHWK